MDTFEKIRACLAEQLDIEPDEITMDSNILDDFGADSLDLVDLVMALEDELRWKCRTTPSRVSTRWATWCVSSRTTPDFCADRHPASPTPWRGARFFNERFAPEGSYRMSEQKKNWWRPSPPSTRTLPSGTPTCASRRSWWTTPR